MPIYIINFFKHQFNIFNREFSKMNMEYTWILRGQEKIQVANIDINFWPVR